MELTGNALTLGFLTIENSGLINGWVNDLSFDSAGNLFVADSGNSTIRRITPAGAVETLAGAAGFATDCVRVDGTSGPCGAGGGIHAG